MVSLKINKQMFFDREAVIQALDRSERRALSKVGAYVRRYAQNSLRRRKRVSNPGSPPSRHSPTNQSLRFILFQYEPQDHRVVIGPVKFNGTGNVPSLMEYGGTQTTVVSRSLSGQSRRLRVARYRPRPFMGPAAEAVAPEMPDIIAREA